MPQAAAGALNANSPSQKPDRWIEVKGFTAGVCRTFTAHGA